MFINLSYQNLELFLTKKNVSIYGNSFMMSWIVFEKIFDQRKIVQIQEKVESSALLIFTLYTRFLLDI